MTLANIFTRLYIVLLMLSLAVDVDFFSIPALSIDSVSISLLAVCMGAGFLIISFQDFLIFVQKHKMILLAAVVFFIFGFISAVTSPFPALYCLKWLFHYGVITGVSFLLLFLFSRDKCLVAFFIKTLICIALAMASVALVESSFESISHFLANTFRNGEYQIVDGHVRAAATLTHPNILGCFMAIGIFLLMLLKYQARLPQKIFLSALLLLTLALGLSVSRNAMLMLMIPTGLMFFHRHFFRTALTVLVVFLFVLFFLSPAASRVLELIRQVKPVTVVQAAPLGTQEKEKFIDDEHTTPMKYDVIRCRFLLWQSALHMFLDHPFFGIGPGGFNLALKKYAHADLLLMEHYKIQNHYLNAHNAVLNIAAEFGLAGMLIVTFVSTTLAKDIVRHYGFFPFSPLQALLAGIFLSFMPDAFFYNRFYMVISITLFLIFSQPSPELSLDCLSVETTDKQNK